MLVIVVYFRPFIRHVARELEVNASFRLFWFLCFPLLWLLLLVLGFRLRCTSSSCRSTAAHYSLCSTGSRLLPFGSGSQDAVWVIDLANGIATGCQSRCVFLLTVADRYILAEFLFPWS